MMTRWLVVPVFLGLATGAAADLRPKPLPACVEADNWASTLKDVPKTFQGISEYSSVHRRAIFQRLSRAERIQLFHEQFTYYRNLPEFSTEQKNFIATVDADLERYYGDSAFIA